MVFQIYQVLHESKNTKVRKKFGTDNKNNQTSQGWCEIQNRTHETRKVRGWMVMDGECTVHRQGQISNFKFQFVVLARVQTWNEVFES
jgi:hypothetical protein